MSSLDQSHWSVQLDENHVVLRAHTAQREDILGEIEVEVFAQIFLPRQRSRDSRAKQIASAVVEITGSDCACWINMPIVGYSRVTKTGEVFFSD